MLTNEVFNKERKKKIYKHKIQKLLATLRTLLIKQLIFVFICFVKVMVSIKKIITFVTYLNEAERTLQHSFDSIYLGMVQFREACSSKALGQLTFQHCILYFMAKKLMIDVTPDRSFINCKRLQSCLHSTKHKRIINKKQTSNTC